VDTYGFSPSPSPWPEGTFASCAGVPSAPSPVDLPGLTGAQRVIAGRAYVCASRAHPTQPVVCWGARHDGLEPVEGVPSPLAALAAGKDHACAISATGAMACWGDGSAGQIAWRGTHRTVAARVAGLAGAASVAAGHDFTCALLEDGAARCWGSNSSRQLGDATYRESGRPVAVVDLTDATQITAGYNHACARRRDGSLWCWGSNGDGQLGPIAPDAYDPQPVAQDGDAGAAPLGAVRAAQAGRGVTCAVRDGADGGVVECWGRNDTCVTARGYGDAGFPCEPQAHAPRNAVPLPFGAAAGVALSDSHACAREAADGGAVACWGVNYVGQANPAQTPPSSWTRPARIALPGPASDVSAGWVSSCAAVGGAALCWGNPARPSAPPRAVVAADAGVAAVRSGRDFDCARLADGTVRCWGDNSHGQLGDGTLTRSDAPVVVLREGAGAPVPLDDVRELSAAGHHACATRGDGVWCWGSDLCGQLGQGNTCRLAAATRIAW
jgi:alpha-tubulin suppressor-like RCC1 family protein